MCLKSLSRRPKVARRDIECYKVVSYKVVKQLGFRTICAPYMGFRLYFGENKAFGRMRKIWGIRNYFYIDAGYIHACTNMQRVEYTLSELNGIKDGCKVYKAIIPKGTRYHKDFENGDVCAKRMIITEEEVKV